MTARVPVLRLAHVMPPADRVAWGRAASLAVHEGEMLALAAPRAWSDLLFRLCVGLVDPGAGHLEVLGERPASLDRAALRRLRLQLGLGLLPDGLVSALTLRENLVVPLVYGGTHVPDAARAAADAMLDDCGLAALAARRPADVSADVRQRAVIARALIRRPRLVLLEDPVSLLVEDEGARLLALCRARAGAVVVSTRRPDLSLARMADAALRWDDGGMRPLAAAA